jgi:acetyl esterase/lipase
MTGDLRVEPQVTKRGATFYSGLTYAAYPGFRPLLLDLYVPRGVVDAPLVVWIHGGGFQDGDRRYLPETYPKNSVFDRPLDAGMAVATIDYRHAAEATFPAQLIDVGAAIDFLREHGAVLGIDAQRIGVWGESAGGALAALEGLTGGRVAAVVAWYAVTDVRGRRADVVDSIETKWLGAPPSAVPELAAAASAVEQVHAGAPPFLIVHGAADTVVPDSHSQRLHELLVAAGAPSTYHSIAGADHCFEGYDDIGGLIDESVAFLARTLSASRPEPESAASSADTR